MSSSLTYLLIISTIKGIKTVRKVVFDKYLELSCYGAMAQRLYKEGVIPYSALMRVRQKIAQAEVELITPRRTGARHQHKLTVIK